MSGYSKSELLQAVLQPLLDDFIYWFGRAQSLLEQRELPDLSTAQQADLLARVHQAQQEVLAAIALFRATGKQAGVDPAAVRRWHELVAECWRASIAYRAADPEEG
ncbi:MAG: DUF2605 domain-containing protein [Elainellaceae cyanobacterium]